MARIKVKMNKLDTTLDKAFKEFIISKTAAGLKEETKNLTIATLLFSNSL